MLTCRCPACDQILFLDDVLTADSWICCDHCDRGVRPPDALCTDCFARNPFFRRDRVSFACMGCGITQPDFGARKTA
ncbi:MAG TPA: hypothetical protein VMT00_04045 [Thermoanaerobaculia bacterium]|nr:hypothetical protein [Thermoanaerobaculia bacterium]